MQLFDMGQRSGPILVFGGPYSNVQALRALRAEAALRGIAADHVICTGDVVAYCADPMACVEEMRDWGVVTVAGNCERQLALGAQDCGCGFEDGTTCDLLSAGWYAYASRQVTAQARDWMAGCPDVVSLLHGGRRVVALHGGLSDISRFVWPVSDAADFMQEISLVRGLCPEVQVVLAGHCGVPFQHYQDGVAWINAGVIGMPPHDGGQATRYMLLHPDGRVEVVPLVYDAAAAAQAMVDAGLTMGYHSALLSGWWPSEDILPCAMRRHKLRRQSSAIG